MNFSNTPENSSWHTTGRVWAPDLVAPAAPMNCFTSMVGGFAPAAVPMFGRKQPMWTATGVRVSCTSCQNGSSSGSGASAAVGERRDDDAAVVEVEHPLRLVDHVLHPGGRQDRLARSADRRSPSQNSVSQSL